MELTCIPGERLRGPEAFLMGTAWGEGSWLLSGVGPAVAKGLAPWAPHHPRQEAAPVCQPQEPRRAHRGGNWL